MNPSDFTDTKTGELVKTVRGLWAFVPNPLPNAVQLSNEAYMLMLEASEAIGELRSKSSLPNIRLLVDPFIRHEAVFSTRIEGTTTGMEQLLLFEMSSQTETSAPERETLNYVNALNRGIIMSGDLSIGIKLMQELHRVLMAGVRGEESNPGRFRTIQNAIVTEGQSWQEARYIPPPPQCLDNLLRDLESYIANANQSKHVPFLAELALIHYQFEAVHPFEDGNGRIGRLLIPLIMHAKDYLNEPLLYLSVYFEAHRTEYYNRLLKISQCGEWEPWVQFFAKGVIQQSVRVTDIANNMLAIKTRYVDTLSSARSSLLLLKLLDRLLAYPAITIPQAAEELNITYRGAQNNVDRLVREGLLTEATGYRRNKIYIAPEIIQLYT